VRAAVTRRFENEAVLTDGGLGGEFFEAVVETAGVGVGVYESDGRFAYVNQAYADLLGMDRDHLHGAAVWDINPTVEEARFDSYWDSFELGETRQRETIHTHTDGSDIPVETHTTAVEIAGVRYHVGTIATIVQRVDSWEQRERQDERLEQFASAVSHDLRNPLNVAMGRLQLAQETTDARHLDHVEQSLNRIEALVEDVLALVRDGNRITDPEPVTLEAVTKRAWQPVETDESTLTVDDEFGRVLSDEDRLLDIFEELFENSVTHAGSDVTVHVARTDDGFYVADDGPGIPESEREDVMEYGYTTTDDGTGFGLTIVEQITTAHGWSISLTESEAGGVRVDFSDVDFE